MGRRIRATFGVWTGVTKPIASNTGATGTLTAVYGDQTITVAGTVLENKDVYGRVIVRAANVTIRNCRIRGGTATTNCGLIDATHSAVSSLTIENCTIFAATPSVWFTGILGHDYTATGCDVYQVVDGFGVYNTASTGLANVTITGNYIHDLSCISPDSNHTDNKTHNDGIQIQGNGGVTITGNNFDLTRWSGSTTGVNITSVVMITPNVSACPAVVITGNWLNAINAGAIINISPKAKGASTTAYIANNKFGRGSSGYQILLDTALTFEGMPTTTGPDVNNNNVWVDTGLPVTVTRKVV